METLIALAGNPNSGKSTLFNTLTGAHQHVGNYPGVTVEKKQGVCNLNGYRFAIVDLPGTYSLTAYSLEEVVARDFLVSERPDVVVNIIDASNLERHLYLTLQIMEMGLPVCIALNMMDVAEHRGVRIDIQALSNLLGVPVVPTVARTGRGREALMRTAAHLVEQNQRPAPVVISYGGDIDPVLKEMVACIRENAFLTETYHARWIALKYLERDARICEQGLRLDAGVSLKLEEMVKKVGRHLQMTLNTEPELVIADRRYGYIKSILKQDVVRFQDNRDRLYISDKLDKVLVNRFTGPLIMLAVLFGLYQFTFTYSEVPVGWLESLFGWLGTVADARLPDGSIKSLIIAGIIDGVGGVLGFVPLIMFMFMGIALLEDSGYLARVAFMLDRVFRIFGLHGNSVMAFIVSGGIAGGCAVPGVMACRTLRSPRERLATLLTVPFMNCGAKLPVFALLVGTFFARNEAAMMFGITLTTWIGALLVARLLRSTMVKGEPTPFVMELPPYRLPTFKGIAIHTWERTWQYVKKAGTVILGISIVLWALMTFPRLSDTQLRQFEDQRRAIQVAAAGDSSVAEQLTAVDREEAEAALRYSIAGRLGIFLESVSAWAGFDWRTNIALVGGFAAKEVIVTTMGTAYALGEVDPEMNTALTETLSRSPHWRPLVALSLMVFVMFYAPCFVSVVCIAREAGSWKWGAFSMVFNTVLAFALAVAVFQVGRLFGY